jgi:peroxiredoxin
MHRTVVTAILIGISGLVAGQTRFVLNGVIKGYEDSTRIIINKVMVKEGEEALTPDQTLFLIDQKFSFSDDISATTRFSVRVRPKDIQDMDFTKYENVSFWAENKPMSLVAEKGSVAFADVSGSAIQDEFEKFVSLEKEKAGRNKRLIDSLRMYYQDLPSATQEAMKSELNSNQSLIEKAELDYLYDHPEHYFSLSNMAFRVTKIPESLEKNKVIAFYEQLSPVYKNDGYGKQIKKYIDSRISFQPLNTGKKPPSFTLRDSTGAKIALSKMKGKILLLDFWFAACMPCRLEHKNYLQVYQAYRNKGFEILSVNIDEKKEMWTNAMRQDSMIWRSVWDPQTKVTSGLYHVQSFPTNYLLNTKGEIIAQDLRGEALSTALEQIFAAD